MNRDAIRSTAGRVNRCEDLIGDEKSVAAAILRANPEFGNPHVVRCDWCHKTTVLFSDEDDAPFKRSGRGWRCETCDMSAASQEVKF